MKTKSLIFYLLLFIPVLNVVADVTIYYFREPGGGQFHLGIIRGIILALLGIWFILKGYTSEKASLPILIFLVYTFILSLFSSDINYSLFSGYLKWFTSLLLFPIGYWVFDSEKKLKILLNVYLIVALIICINLLYAQVTKFGITTYLEDTFYTGGAGVGITNNLAVIILSSVILFEDYKYSHAKKFLFFGIIFISLVFLLISLKRAAILGLFIGIISFLFFSRRRTNFLKYLAVIIVFFILSFPLFEDILLPRIEVRLDEMEQIENEARLKDFDNVLNELKEGNISLILFGTEAFNSRQFYGPKYFGRGRMIHGDFTTILYGTGMIGLFLFSSIFIVLFYWFFKHIKTRNTMLRRLLITYFSVLICFLLISITGSGSIGFLTLVFLFLGSTKRVFEETERKMIHEKNSTVN